MSIDEKTVKHIAKLGRLELTPEEEKLFQEQLGNILGYVDKLKELNIDNVEPLVHASEMTNVFREDKPKPSLDKKLVLDNSPQKDENFFKVPKVIK